MSNNFFLKPHQSDQESQVHELYPSSPFHPLPSPPPPSPPPPIYNEKGKLGSRMTDRGGSQTKGGFLEKTTTHRDKQGQLSLPQTAKWSEDRSLTKRSGPRKSGTMQRQMGRAVPPRGRPQKSNHLIKDKGRSSVKRASLFFHRA